MKLNYLLNQYKKDSKLKISHNYLKEQFFDYSKIFVDIKKVVKKGDYTLGRVVDECEKSFAKKTGAKYAISVGNGTDALFLSLKVLNIGKNDEVITTPFTFVATVASIVNVGAKPVFVDIKDDYNIDENKIESAVTKKTKAIITIIDSDGEDDPKKIKKLINLAKKNPNSIITANRLKRTENIFFKFLYKLHLLITFLFTGRYINFGNYCSFNSLNLKKLLSNANLWLACSAGIIKNCDSIKSHYADRKKRYFDASKASLLWIFKHSLSIISVFKSDVQRNSLIYCSILLLIFLFVKMTIFIVAIIIIIIFNIMIHYQGKQIYSFHNCLNLIKHIKNIK